MTFPSNPIAAVTHPDPYPYYTDLGTRAPLAWNATLGLWVAASAEAVTAVLTSELCRVRPTTEPVPRSLLGSPAADIFRHLTIAQAGIETLLHAGLDLERLATSVTYRPSANARIPVFGISGL